MVSASLVVAALVAAVAPVAADYGNINMYFNPQCSGSPVVTGAQLSTFGCMPFQNNGYLKTTCINSTTATYTLYADAACTAAVGSSVRPFGSGCMPSGDAGIFQSMQCVVSSAAYSLPAASGPKGSATIAKTQYESTTACSGTINIQFRYNGGCQNNGVNSSVVSCLNATHALAATYAGTGCSGRLIDTDYMRIGCTPSADGAAMVTCDTISSATAARLGFSGLLFAVVLAMVSYFKF